MFTNVYNQLLTLYIMSIIVTIILLAFEWPPTKVGSPRSRRVNLMIKPIQSFVRERNKHIYMHKSYTTIIFNSWSLYDYIYKCYYISEIFTTSKIHQFLKVCFIGCFIYLASIKKISKYLHFNK